VKVEEMKKIIEEIIKVADNFHGHPTMESKLREFKHSTYDMNAYWNSHRIVDIETFRRLKRLKQKLTQSTQNEE
jgi:hypothetical protein